MTLTYDLGVRNFHKTFLVMLTICVHELNWIWAFFVDENCSETPKVVTLTFVLENRKQPHYIKLWCILYLNTKFDGCSLKTVYVANLYITLLQRRKKLQWPLVTLTFEIWSPKKMCTIPVACLTFVPKMKSIRPLISEEFGTTQTHKQTEDLPLLQYRLAFDSNCPRHYIATIRRKEKYNV